MHGRRLLSLALLAATGCIYEDVTTMLVSSDPFNQRAAQRERVAYAPAAVETAARVEGVGRKLLAANPQIGLRPVFRTIGAPQPEIFHVGSDEVNITEGLVNQCKTEGELAAVIAHELGTIVAERESIAWPRGKAPDREPPAQFRVGNDYTSTGSTPDMTHLAELGKHEKENGSPNRGPARPPDPRIVARSLLTRAGYAEKELESVTRLITGAAINPVFETQFKNATPAPRQPIAN